MSSSWSPSHFTAVPISVPSGRPPEHVEAAPATQLASRLRTRLLTTIPACVQDCEMTNYSPLLALFVLAPRLRRASHRAVSIYLPARSEGYDARFYDIEFRDLLHRYSDRLSAKDRELMEYEMRRLRHHVAVVRP